MFIVFIIIALLLLLTAEFFYLKNLLERVFTLWQLDTSKRRTRIIKYIVMGVLMAMTALIFTVPGMVVLHIVLAAGFIDFVCLIVRFIARRNFKAVRIISCSGILPIIIGVSMVVYGCINIHNVVATEYTVHTEKELEQDYKIAFLSDIHMGVSLDFDEIEEMCNEISAQSPDVLLLGGDIVDESTTTEEMKKVFELLSKVKTKYGIYFVYGNHDIPRNPDTGDDDFSAKDLEKAITSTSITILTDEIVNIGNDIALIGHRDASFKGDDLVNERIPIKELTEKVDKNRFVLLLDHQPTQYEDNKNAGVDLMVSGHTHAGQIWPAGWFTTLLAKNEQNYGMVTDGSFNAIVSSGVAGWGFPIKTEKHAEYLIITITDK